MDAGTLIKLREYLSIAHHIPGRIRLKIKSTLLADPQALKLAGSVDFSSWGNGSRAIINTRFNPGAGSLVVDYEPGLLEPDLIAELFSSPDGNRVAELVEQLADLIGLKIQS